MRPENACSFMASVTLTAGEEDSGKRPEIQITMESADGALEEKIKVWDAILDSFKPKYPMRK